MFHPNETHLLRTQFHQDLSQPVPVCAGFSTHSFSRLFLGSRCVAVRGRPGMGLEQSRPLIYTNRTCVMCFGRHWTGWSVILYDSSGPNMLRSRASGLDIWKLSAGNLPINKLGSQTTVSLFQTHLFFSLSVDTRELWTWSLICNIMNNMKELLK